MRRAIIAAAIASTITAIACAPIPSERPYEMCSEPGCGDNVVFVIDNDTSPDVK